MKSVCLIHPNHENSTDSRLDPPLGLLYIASHLKKNNINVEVVDLSNQPKENWNIPPADFYGITTYVTSLKETRLITQKCKEINPMAKVICGGAHPSSCPNDFPYVDHVVVGPGEVAMYDIITGQNRDHIIMGTKPDNYFPFPSYDLIDPYSYHRLINNKHSLPILTSRNCPYKCSFCGLSKMHKLDMKVEYANEDVIISQLKRIKNEYGINSINFQDDIFTLNRKRLYKILDATKELGITFRCMGRAGMDIESVYEKLAESGCESSAWGIESGNQYILNRMNKQVKVQDNYNVIQWAKKYGIISRAFFIIGFPGETKETLEETKRFIEWSDPDQYFVSTFIPYVGTEVGDNPLRFGIINKSNDYNQYFQVSKSGLGGITIDTKWLSRDEFRELEIEFRNWINKRPMRGMLQEYEKRRIKK